MEKMIGPTNKPINPDIINPPITPRKITSMGTTAPLPKSRGFRTLSESPLKTKKTVHKAAVVLSPVEKR